MQLSRDHHEPVDCRTENMSTSWFWAEHIWLPSNVTWSTFHAGSYSSGFYQNKQPLSCAHQPLCVAVIVCLLRLVLTRLIFRPAIAYYTVEKSKFPRIGSKIVRAGNTAVSNGISSTRPTAVRPVLSAGKLQRSCDALWYFSYFLFASVYGAWTLWDKDYLTDTRLFWVSEK